MTAWEKNLKPIILYADQNYNMVVMIFTVSNIIYNPLLILSVTDKLIWHLT